MLLFGVSLLYIGGEWIVDGGVHLARRFNLSPLLIGIAIIGFGTSLPELVVSLSAHLDGRTDVAIGNVVGSNITNILLVLGTAAFIAALPCSTATLKKDGVAMILATTLFIVLALSGTLSFVTGVLLVTLLGTFLYLRYRWERRDRHEPTPSAPIEHAPPDGQNWKAWFWILAATALLWGGSKLFVGGAVKGGELFGLNGAVIGLTIVALGTSLPELATTVVAAFRRETDLLLGNILGSNLFNILCIVGITALVAPIPMADRFIAFDLWVLAGVTAFFVLFGFTDRKVVRWEGAALLGGYIAYLSIVPAQ